MSNAIVGNIYDHIIKEVIENSRVDFEEGGVDESVLEELREGWQKKLTQLKVAEFPWDPKPDSAPAGAPAPGPSEAAPAYAQQQLSPQAGALPLPMDHGVLNGQQGAGDVVPKLEPGIKQEPDLNPVMMPGPYTDPGSVAAARATQALRENYGNRAMSSINAIQAGMTAQNPGMQPRPGMNGHMPMPQPSYQQQPHQQTPGQQHPHNPLPMPQMPQTDGAPEAEAEGVLMQRDDAGNLVEMGRIDIDRMMHTKIMANAKSMEGGGFMVPLKEAAKYPNASASRKNRKAAAPGQVDGGDERVENPEDAINSDLDDTDDGGDESEHDEEGLSHIMLCMYDKVQRVKNKWKCTLKDGVLTVNGKEYVFHKATGEYEW